MQLGNANTVCVVNETDSFVLLNTLERGRDKYLKQIVNPTPPVETLHVTSLQGLVIAKLLYLAAERGILAYLLIVLSIT